MEKKNKKVGKMDEWELKVEIGVIMVGVEGYTFTFCKEETIQKIN